MTMIFKEDNERYNRFLVNKRRYVTASRRVRRRVKKKMIRVHAVYIYDII